MRFNLGEKLGFLLGLLGLAGAAVGLLGAGLQMLAPEHTEIGWALIVFGIPTFIIAVAGLIALTLHHWGIVLPIGRHKNWAASVIALPFLAVGGYLWSVSHEPELRELSSQNARLDVLEWHSTQLSPADHRLVMNVFIENVGAISAIGMQHHGVMEVSTKILPAGIIESWFNVIKDGLSGVDLPDSSEIRPGISDQMYSMPYRVEDMKANIQDISFGSFVYIFNVMRYRDRTLQNSHSIYTEECNYIVNNMMHPCESGHNRSYIEADRKPK
jgi:hypothetical protein